MEAHSTPLSSSLLAALGLATFAALAPLPARAAPEVGLNVRLADPLVTADRTTITQLQISLTGFALEADARRPPVSLAVVLDRSGSMAGEKLARAKEAAALVVERLRADDELAILTYDDGVDLLAPIGPLTNRDAILARLRAIEPGGSTALYAGVAKGAEELRRSRARAQLGKQPGAARVYRVILLSDGQANVGPSSPAELARLGASLAREGTSVSTIGLGLGYNEDLMAGLARAADGNHAFVEGADQLARIFDAELGEVTQVVAQELGVDVRLGPGVRCLRALNRDVELRGDRVFFRLGQLYATQERFVILEVEVPAARVDDVRTVADVTLSYANAVTRTPGRQSASARVRYARDPDAIARAVDRDTRTKAVEAIANAESRAAVALRDQGRLDEAEAAFKRNAEYLDQNAASLSAPKLKSLSTKNLETAEAVKRSDWGKQRKAVRKLQHELDSQQRY